MLALGFNVWFSRTNIRRPGDRLKAFEAAGRTHRMDAVLFDMDGVLVNSEDFWNEFEEEFVFSEAVDGDAPSHDEITGMNFREIYDYLDENYETTLDKEAFVGRYEERAETVYGEEVDLLDGARELLDDLRDRGVKVAIVSSAPQSWIGAVLDRFDLGEFARVISAEDIDAPGKPEPHVYEHAASELDVDAENCAVVEDSRNGAKAAVRAGTYCVAYRSDHNADTDLSVADVVVGSPEELRTELLAAVNGERTRA